MSKADKMFEELGYEKDSHIEGYDYIYKPFGGDYVDSNFTINTLYKIVVVNKIMRPMKKEEHLAIHEKMKELGWLE